MRHLVLLAITLVATACSEAHQHGAAEAALRAADERHRQADVAGDVAAMTELTHPRLTLNAPNNRIVSRNELLSLMRAGQLGTQSMERVPEAILVDGDVGIIMGRESVVLAPTSISGRMYGTARQDRRYTNIYVRQAGAWKLIGRHANFVPENR